MQTLSFQSADRLRRHNLLLGWMFGHIKVEPDGEEAWKVSVGGESLSLVNPNRWRRYRKGIPRQLRRLARTYGATSFADQFAGKTVIDIGANIGEFSLFASAHGASVIAIEPDPTTLDVLRRNVRSRNVRVVGKAVWKETARVPLHVAPMYADSGLIAAPTSTATQDVEAVRLDDLTSELNIDEIFFVKGDAEGAEPEVIEGAFKTLARTRYLSLDCGPERQGQTTVADTARLLEGAGFAVRLLRRRRTIVFGRNRHLTEGASPCAHEVGERV